MLKPTAYDHHTQRNREEMDGKQAKAQPDQRREHVRGNARCRRTPMRVWRMMKNDPIATGKNANTPEKYEPIELLAAVTDHAERHQPARQARSAPVSSTRLVRPSIRKRRAAKIAIG